MNTSRKMLTRTTTTISFFFAALALSHCHSVQAFSISSSTTTTTTTTTSLPTCFGWSRQEKRNAKCQRKENRLQQRLLSSSRLSLKVSDTTDDDNSNQQQPSLSSPPPITREDDTKPIKLDWKIIGQQAQLFRQMALPYYQDSATGKWLLAALLGLTLLNSGVSVAFSYLSKDFWNALSAKDAPEFYFVLQKYLAALVIGAPVVTYYKYQREQLAVHWREWMTARTCTLYTNNRVYYKLEQQQSADGNSTGGVDNPDQRIAEDVNTFTGYSLQLVITILTSLIDLVSFSTILWSIYPQLFGAIILYAAIGTVVTAFLGQSLVGLNFFQLQREADLRYVLVRLRDNAESIAFYGGEDLEGQAVERRLESVMENRRDINKAQRNLEFFTTAYRYLIQIVPVAVVAPKYFAGDIALGIISQSVGAFNHILSDLSIIINQFERLSAFSAGIERLSTFYEAIREVDLQRNESTPLLAMPAGSNESVESAINGDGDNEVVLDVDDSVVENGALVSSKDEESYIRLQEFPMALNGIEQHARGSVVLQIQGLNLYTPDRKRMLVQNLNLTLYEGQDLLIVGNSGAGKSSLLRGIAGLWTAGQGTISRPASEQVYFLPQRPYCTLGSLKDQLLYPSLDYSAWADDDGENVATTSKVVASSSNTNGETKKNGETSKKKRKKNENDDQQQQRIVPRAHILKQSLTDDDLLDILQQVDLLDVAQRAGNGNATAGLRTVLDWTNVLSLGEQQRLAFGRLLVNQPKLVILDEATSALDMVAEARMYTLLKTMAQKHMKNGQSGLSAPGLTYISVGHRPSLLAHHDKRLRLAGPDEDYELTDIEKSAMDLASSLSSVRNL